MSVKKTRVGVVLTTPYLDGVDRLVEAGIYMDRQTVIREALQIFLGIHGIPPFYPEAEG